MSDDNMNKIEQALRTAYQQSESPVQPGEHWRRQVMERISAAEETVQLPQAEPFSVPTLFPERPVSLRSRQQWCGALQQRVACVQLLSGPWHFILPAGWTRICSP